MREADSAPAAVDVEGVPQEDGADSVLADVVVREVVASRGAAVVDSAPAEDVVLLADSAVVVVNCMLRVSLAFGFWF